MGVTRRGTRGAKPGGCKSIFTNRKLTFDIEQSEYENISNCIVGMSLNQYDLCYT